MTTFNVPTRSEVTANNQAIFDNLEKGLGFVPNLYATLANSSTALEDYLGFANRKMSLNAKEKEIINLVVSEVNQCSYCLSAHTALGKMNGFNDEQVLEIRSGEISFDAKFEALASFVKETTINKGKPSQASVQAFFDAGYNKENLIDALVAIGTKIVSNFVHGVTQVPVDFPAVPELETA